MNRTSNSSQQQQQQRHSKLERFQFRHDQHTWKRTTKRALRADGAPISLWPEAPPSSKVVRTRAERLAHEAQRVANILVERKVCFRSRFRIRIFTEQDFVHRSGVIQFQHCNRRRVKPAFVFMHRCNFLAKRIQPL